MSKENRKENRKIINKASVDMKFTRTPTGGPMPEGGKCETTDKPDLKIIKEDKTKQ